MGYLSSVNVKSSREVKSSTSLEMFYLVNYPERLKHMPNRLHRVFIPHLMLSTDTASLVTCRSPADHFLIPF